MKEYTINVFIDKKFTRTYRTSIIPMIGDMISFSEKELFKVELRMIPSNNTSDVILVFGKYEA